MLLVPTVIHSYAKSEDSLTMLTTATVTPTISIAANSRVQLEVAPKSNGSFSSSISNLDVATNSSNGYSIYMSTGDHTQNLKNTDASIEAKIGPVTANSSSNSFAVNTWGYSLDNGENKTYQPVPATVTNIKQTDTSTPTQNYELTFGTFIDTSLPAGEYYNTVIISAVANPNTFNSLSDIVYMQQMTNEICENTISEDMQNPATKQLIDTRDGKSYWVAKLADGRCWMTQNLALDIRVNENGTSNIKAGDSDVAEDWNTTPNGTGWTKNSITGGLRPGFSYSTYTKSGSATYYPPVTTETTIPTIVDSPSTITSYSWNLGEYVITNPSGTKPSGCEGISDIEACTTMGKIINVSSTEGWKPTFTATETSSVDLSTKTYDPHYLIGNYYQWNTATAGTGGDIKNAIASESICPKGWQLPTSGGNNNSTQGSAYFLLDKYGLTSSALNNDTGYNIFQSPIHFVYGGSINIDFGKLWYMAHEGSYWSSQSSANKTDAYTFAATDTSSIPSISDDRFAGHTIRCINSPSI